MIFRLGQAYYRMGDTERGLYHMRRSFENGPPITANQLKLADILLREGKPEQLQEAQEYLLEVLVMERNNVDAMVVRGRVFEK